MTYKFAYVIFLLYFRPTALKGPLRNYSRSILQLAHNSSKIYKYASKFIFSAQIICTIDYFVVLLQRKS